MKWKKGPADFRVQERLRPGYLRSSGAWRVYRVTKRKLTSLEAAAALAQLAGVPAGEVKMAGLKDRQGVTCQFMSIRGGRPLRTSTPELTIETAGSASTPISSKDSEGNSFRIRVRELAPHDVDRIRAGVSLLRAQGLPNYFDEQRFGNLRHEQGWIARELMLGRHELALRRLLGSPSPHDDARSQRFKAALAQSWGDWSECREAAGRFGAHHSLFEHLRRSPDDFAGAFERVSTRLKLIHLYAFQSHVWNRAVARYLARLSAEGGAAVWNAIEGPLVFPLAPVEPDPAMGGSFRLPGAGLEDVEHPVQRALLTEVLAADGLVPSRFRVESLSGFALKGEDRALFVRPGRLRAKAPEHPVAPAGGASALLSFDLPRGAYATLVVRALLSRPERGRIDLDRLEARAREEGREGPASRRDEGERGAPGSRRPPPRPRPDRDREDDERPRGRVRRPRR